MRTSSRFAVVGIATVLALVGTVPAVSGGSSGGVAGGRTANTAPAGGATETALAYVRQHAAEFGFTSADVAEIRVTDTLRDAHTGVSHVYIRQQLNDLDILGAEATVNVAANGNIISAPTNFVANLQAAASGSMALGAVPSAEAAADELGLEPTEEIEVLETTSAPPTPALLLSDGGIAEGPIPAKLVYQKLDDATVRLAWNLEIEEDGGDHYWNVSIDAATGALVSQNDYVVHENLGLAGAALAATGIVGGGGRTAATNAAPAPPTRAIDGSAYNVFAVGFESPNDGPQTNEVNPADGLASPWGWHDTNGVAGPEFTITRGNNAHAYLDTDNNNAPDTGALAEPNGGLTLQFNFPHNPRATAANNRPLAVTQLFYSCNAIHDLSYHYGFTEEAGNFQANNYGRTSFSGGANDYARCEAQDGGGTNNANFSTPTDGSLPRMQMYLWPSTTFINELAISLPSSAAGSYGAVGANFGPTPTTAGPITAPLSTTSPANACTALTGFPAGAIAIVDRSGSCAFTVQVQNAQDAGAVAVVVANNVTGNPPTMTGSAPLVTIPAIAVTLASGNTIKAGLPTSGTVQNRPNRDGDLDAGVVYHEYGHGISNRLTGGRTNVSCLGNQEQMGEGWSDWQAINLTHQPTDTATGRRGMGTYVLFQDQPYRNNTGIRVTAYSTDMTINPSTYDTIKTAAVPHGIGWVWASMLWEMQWNLINKYGYNPNPYEAWNTGGNNLAMQLVMDGMKFQPCQPGFVTGRNAILAADVALTGGVNKCLIWRGFAKRGLGFSANQGASSSRSDGTQAFDNHPDCRPQVGSAPAAFSKALVENTQTSDTLTVSNLAFAEGENLNWTITETDTSCATPTDLGWVSTAPASGTTAAAGSTAVTVTFDATGLTAPNIHTGRLCLASNGGATIEVPLTLQVQHPFAGFYHPLGSDPNVANSGNARPIKFSLGGDNGLAIFAAGSPASQQVDCSSRVATGPLEVIGTSGGSSLQYDPLADQYTYVWKTQKAWKGTCRILYVTLNDASVHTAFMRFT